MCSMRDISRSIEDIGFFLYETTVRILVVVANQGMVHYIMKDRDYDYKAAEKLRPDCTEDPGDKLGGAQTLSKNISQTR